MKIDEGHLNRQTLKLTTQLLNWNPEYYTIWNHRRRILIKLSVSYAGTASSSSERSLEPHPDLTTLRQLLHADLSFLLPLLKRFPKCYWIWNHRQWLLSQASKYLPHTEAQETWRAELDLVGKLLARDERNFHGWRLRRVVLAELIKLQESSHEAVRQAEGRIDAPQLDRGSEQPDGKFYPPSNTPLSLMESEFEYTTTLLHRNLSNFSAYHHRTIVIPLLLLHSKADNTARRTLFDGELNFIKDALIDPYDQSIWYYHRYLMDVLLHGSKKGEDGVADIKEKQTADARQTGQGKIRMAASQFLGWVEFTKHEREDHLRKEIHDIRDQLTDGEYDDCKWFYQYLLDYSFEYMELESGATKIITTKEMRNWFQELDRLDPKRARRWNDERNRMDNT